MNLSRRSSLIQPQPMFSIMEQARKLESEGRHIIHLEIGDTSGFVNARLQELVSKHASQSRFGYSPAAGEMCLRETIADLYAREKKTRFTAENVAIAPANSLIVSVLSALTDPGDGVRIPVPGFPTYSLAAKYLGLTENRGDIRVIIVNPESNPLGKYVSPAMLETMTETKHVPVIFDEAYRRFCYTQRDEFPHAPNHIYLWSLSKEHAAPGLRIGAVIGPPELVKKVADFTSLTVSCVPGFIQEAVSEYLHNGEDYSQHVSRVIQRHRALARDILLKSPNIELGESNAAFYVWAGLRNVEPFTIQTAAHYLLERAGVAVCCGYSFGGSCMDFRLTLSVTESDLVEGCNRIVEFANGLERRVA